MTVSPYLGPGSLQPAVDTARQYGGGLFVLARTSNPDAGTFQHATVGERSVAQVVVDTVRGWNTPGWVVGDPLPDIGAVRDLASRFGPRRVLRRRRRRDPARDGRRPRRARRADPRPGPRCPGRVGRGPAPAVRHRPGRRPHGVAVTSSPPGRTRRRCGPPRSAGRGNWPPDGSTFGVSRTGVSRCVAGRTDPVTVPEHLRAKGASDLRTSRMVTAGSTRCERARHRRDRVPRQRRRDQRICRELR